MYSILISSRDSSSRWICKYINRGVVVYSVPVISRSSNRSLSSSMFITLVSSDGQSFVVNQAVAYRSATIREMISSGASFVLYVIASIAHEDLRPRCVDRFNPVA